ncbi:MAG: hypothetical protein ACI86M_002265 [Saprospiraceae bacterium]|jgi:hypothetical protein
MSELKIRTMNIRKFAPIILFAMFMLSFSWPKKLDQKVKTTISKTFNLGSFDLYPVTVDEAIERATEKKINECLFTVKSGGELLGYTYVGEAPSMKNVFDYAIVFSPDMEIINTKVLIYREKHGRQIGMKRWLKQFFGMTTSDRPKIGMQVDGISGATISATSMTDAVREVLASMSYLQKQDKL